MISASRKTIVTLVVGLALLLPAAAMAESGSTCQAYNPQLCGVSGITTRSPGEHPDPVYVGSTGSSTLPFTGLDLALLLATSGALLAAGLLVRRLSRTS